MVWDGASVGKTGYVATRKGHLGCRKYCVCAAHDEKT